MQRVSLLNAVDARPMKCCTVYGTIAALLGHVAEKCRLSGFENWKIGGETSA